VIVTGERSQGLTKKRTTDKYQLVQGEKKRRGVVIGGGADERVTIRKTCETKPLGARKSRGVKPPREKESWRTEKGVLNVLLGQYTYVRISLVWGDSGIGPTADPG